MTFEITDIALSDIEEITDFISKKNKKAAIDLLRTFYKTFKTLEQNPKIGNTRYDLTDKSVMFFVIKKKYLAVYNLKNNKLTILRVLSTYRDIISLL
ncbi:MAG: type II toxin-antitoxin system RelE/ParE family toxin [Candidatus Gastranaerophilaceae bacterium]